jgi:hypothetical protein
MSLIYDPSAIRYSSTQTAYGCTWTLQKTEDDGAQVWKNAKGQEAIVQKTCDQVRQNHRQYRFNIDDKDYGIDRINKRIASQYPPIERKLGTPSDHGMFAGKAYPKRKTCTKPKEGDKSVSAGNNFLYQYSCNEWWVVGQFGKFLDNPEPSSSYNFNKSRSYG